MLLAAAAVLRLPETSFYMKRVFRILQFQASTDFNPEKNSTRNFDSFILPRSTHVSALPVSPRTSGTFNTFYSFQCLQISKGSTLIQHSPFRMHILQDQLDSTENSIEYQLNFLQTFQLQRRGDVVILVRMTLSAKI